MSESIHWVYIVASMKDGLPCAPIKIGVSNKPDHRLASLQTANPEKLILFAVFSLPREWAVNVEGDMHEILANECIRGEWFSTDPVQAAAALCQWMVYLAEEMPDAESRAIVLNQSGTIRTLEKLVEYERWLKRRGDASAAPAN